MFTDRLGEEKTRQHVFTYAGNIKSEDFTTNEFPIRGLRVDNYTAQWLYCDSLRRYIPPLTLGWEALVTPAAQGAKFTWVCPPSGAAPRPSAGGNDALITLFGRELPDTNGTPFGLGSVAIPAAPHEALSARVSAQSPATPQTTEHTKILDSPGIGYRFRLWGWGIAMNPNTQAGFRFSLRNNTDGVILHDVNLSDGGSGIPFMPFGAHGVQMQDNNALYIRCYSDVASKAFWATVHYSREAAV